MKAVILAGGKGTRLGDLAKDVPKPMVRIAGKPILEHQILLLKKYGFKDVLILTEHLSEVIEEFFGDGSRYDLSIIYSKEKKPLGTAGAIRAVENSLSDHFLVLYGDVILDMQLADFVAFHKKHKCDATIAVHPNDHPFDSDLLAAADDGRVQAFYAKPHKKGHFYNNLVNAGAYVLSKRILADIPQDTKCDFGRDIFPRISPKGSIYAYRTAEYIKDVGTPERLREVEKDILSGRVARFNKDYKRPAVFIDRDGVINADVEYLHRPEHLEILPAVPEAIKKINCSDYLAVVVTNQPVVARNLCSIDELNSIHKKMETVLGEDRAKLDRIYFCPHHPDKGFEGENKAFKIACDCRKPGTGMLERAVADYNIDLASSYIIGDSFRDIECGKRAKITTVGVRTGKGCRDGKVKPDYFFSDLKQAVDFIVDDPLSTTYASIKKMFREGHKKPFIVSVAGNARTGKSTVATYLKKMFAKEQIKTLVIELDNWLLGVSDRAKTANVFDRYQISKLEADLRDVMAGKTIKINEYNPVTRGPHTDREVEVSLKNSEFVLLDGVIALALPYFRNIAHTKIFCSIDQKSHFQRVMEFYRWKGLSNGEIEALYKSRKKDEYDLIEKDREFADIVISL